MKKIGIASDHAGYEMKEFLVGYLNAMGYEGIRAGLCWDTEIASLIRRHNDANIIVFPARFITNDEAVKMLDAYFAAEFEGGRHIARIAKMPVAGCK